MLRPSLVGSSRKAGLSRQVFHGVGQGQILTLSRAQAGWRLSPPTPCLALPTTKNLAASPTPLSLKAGGE